MITPDMARRARLTVACPHCRAPIGTQCTVLSSGRRLTQGTCHPSRVEAVTHPLGGAA